METPTFIILDGKTLTLSTTWDHNRVSDKTDRKRVSAEATAQIKRASKEYKPNFKREFPGDEFHSIATCRIDTKSKKVYSLSQLVNLRIEALHGHKNWAIFVSLGDDLFWTAGARDGLINPTTEFSGTHDECLMKFSDSIQAIDETEKGIFTNVQGLNGDFTLIQLEELLPNKKDKVWKQALLFPTSGLDINPAYIFALLFIGSGYFGIDYYTAMKAEEEQAAMLAQAKAASPPVKPWASIPGPKELYTTCNNAFRQVNQIIPGWELAVASCDITKLTSTFEHDKYYDAWGISSITKTFPTGKLEFSGAKFVVSIPNNIGPKHSQESPPNAEDTIRRIYSVAGTMADGKIDIKPDNQEKPTTFKLVANFNIDSVDIIINLIDSISTLRVDKYEFLPKENRLKFEGTVYVQS